MKLEIPAGEYVVEIPYWGIAVAVVIVAGAVYWLLR